jgi:hypothetical protein
LIRLPWFARVIQTSGEAAARHHALAGRNAA